LIWPLLYESVKHKSLRSGIRFKTILQPNLTSPHLEAPHLTSPHLTSPHLTSPHLTSPHLTSPHLTSFQLISPISACFPGDLQWQDWQAWSKCSATCGKGIRLRLRACFPPRNGGKDCPPPGSKDYSESSDCLERRCVGELNPRVLQVFY
jgi:hypothetical protein